MKIVKLFLLFFYLSIFIYQSFSRDLIKIWSQSNDGTQTQRFQIELAYSLHPEFNLFSFSFLPGIFSNVGYQTNTLSPSFLFSSKHSSLTPLKKSLYDFSDQEHTNRDRQRLYSSNWVSEFSLGAKIRVHRFLYPGWAFTLSYSRAVDSGYNVYRIEGSSPDRYFGLLEILKSGSSEILSLRTGPSFSFVFENQKFLFIRPFLETQFLLGYNPIFRYDSAVTANVDHLDSGGSLGQDFISNSDGSEKNQMELRNSSTGQILRDSENEFFISQKGFANISFDFKLYGGLDFYLAKHFSVKLFTGIRWLYYGMSRRQFEVTWNYQSISRNEEKSEKIRFFEDGIQKHLFSFDLGLVLLLKF